MVDCATPPTLRTNRLLAALPPTEYAALAAHLTVVHPPNGATLYGPGEPIAQVYFPLTGVASVIATMADGAMVEAGTIGREGVVGLPAFLDADAGPLATISQVPGAYARLPVGVFRAVAVPGTTLATLLQRFSQALYTLAAISGACNRLHPVAQRCARWLLLTQDRAGTATFALTHEFLGYMLGVRRPTVTLAVAVLQRAGLLTYHRGVVTIRDRPGLEAAACECYASIVGEYTRLLG
jgi:CRP-like cAMP-binding protein